MFVIVLIAFWCMLTSY